jgi:hypothetical protein
MKKLDMKQQWTSEEIQAAIAKALEHEPEGANKEYWTTDCTVQDIKEKHGLKKFKPSPLKIVLVRECCGEECVHVLANKRGLNGLSDWRCMDPQCRLRTVVMPFGKFAGLTVALVYEQQPSYLAWFHETVEGCEEVKAVIRGLDGIEAHLVAFRQKQRSSQKPLTSTQQQVEWLMGKFSAQTIDSLCEELFGPEE